MRRTWPAWAALIGYAALLALLASPQASGTPREAARFRAQLAPDPLSVAGDLALGGLADVMRFLPLGFLAVLAMGPGETRLGRLLRVWLPGVLLATLLAAGVAGLEIGRPWTWPGALDLALPLVGGVVGAWLGLAWRRGWRVRLLIFPKVALLLLFAASGLGALLYLALDRGPLDFEPVKVTSTEKRRLHEALRDKNPAKLPEGKIAELRLTAHDLNLLLAWGLSLGDPGRKAKVELTRDASLLQISVRLPARGLTRYLNLRASGEASIEQGRLSVRAYRLALGRLETPGWILDRLAPLAARVIAADRRVKPLLEAIRSLRIDSGLLTLSYTHAEPPQGVLADLFHGEGTREEEIPAIQAHLQHLIGAAKGFRRDPEGRFGRSLETAFRLARERSNAGQAVAENRAAILALGMLLGHWRVETLVGRVIDVGTLQKGVRMFRGTTLRGRDDWPKHFFVSAALSVLAVSSVSDAAGLLKEEVDAGGGSGFSFADLLADRAGATFAAAATRDEKTARAFQDRLARGFRVDDFFPRATGLPEGLQDAELRSRYGGVGGEGYARLAEEIEKRIGACDAYRTPP